jgi:hypothetical protein
MVPNPREGTNVRDLDPEVQIDQVDPASGAFIRRVASFTTTTGSGSERVRDSGSHYLVDFHADLFDLDVDQAYRIRVLLRGKTLGFADVELVGSAKELKKVDSDEYVPLVDGRTLPIKFRIEAAAAVKCAGVLCTAHEPVSRRGYLCPCHCLLQQPGRHRRHRLQRQRRLHAH